MKKEFLEMRIAELKKACDQSAAHANAMAGRLAEAKEILAEACNQEAKEILAEAGNQEVTPNEAA